MKSILHLAFAILACASTFAAEIETAAARAQRIEIPRVDFRETTLQETCEFLTQKSRQLDPKAVNIIIAAEAPGKITLNLEKRPLLVVLREAAAQVGCEVQEEPFALVIRKKGAPKLPAIVVPNELEPVRKKLDQFVLPRVDFRECAPREAIEFLVQKSKQLDPDGAGVGMILKLDVQGGGGVPAAPVGVAGIPGLDGDLPPNAAPVPARLPGPRITLRCDEMPLLEVIRYAAGLAGLEVELDDKHPVNIHPPKAKPQAR